MKSDQLNAPHKDSCESNRTAKHLPESLKNRVGFLLAQVSSQIYLTTLDSLKELKLTPRHLGVLDYLQATGACTQAHIGEMVSIDRTTMVQVIDDLEERKLVARGQHPNDRRCHQLSITPQGIATHKAAIKLAELAQKDFLSVLSKRDSEIFLELLRQLYFRKNKD